VVRVAYVHRADGFTEKTVQAQDLASIEIQGGEVSALIDQAALIAPYEAIVDVDDLHQL
jgi:hypothetical protein